MSTSAAALAFVGQILGWYEVAAELGDGHRAGTVLRVRDRGDREYFVKHHVTKTQHEREVYAYRYWTPVLGCCAPRLVAADDLAMTVILTALPGQPCQDAGTAEIHRQAGALLRRFHHSAPARRPLGYHSWVASRAGYWADRTSHLLSPQEQTLIDMHLAALAACDIPLAVPCHLDFQPRNWVVSQIGTLQLVDFEHARTDIAARDLVRLQFRAWATRPDLRDAFFAGYGRHLTEQEQQLTRHLGALDVLSALGRGNDTGDTGLIALGRSTLDQLREPS